MGQNSLRILYMMYQVGKVNTWLKNFSGWFEWEFFKKILKLRCFKIKKIAEISSLLHFTI